MADNDNDDANATPLNKNLLKAIQAITSFDPTGSPSANRKSLEDKLIKLAVTLQMFQFTSRQIRPLTRLREEGFHQMVAEELGPEETDHKILPPRSLDTIALLALDDMIVASRNEDVLEERRRSLRPSAGLLSQNLEDATRPSSPSIADFGVRSPDFR